MQSLAPKIRVLVIDDSIVARRMLAHSIGRTTDLSVEATAANGRIGTAKLRLNPFDAVVLDVEMPEMDGLQTLKAIREIDASVPVIMFSSLTRRGAETTLDALALGANDYVTKPTSSSREAAEQHIATELVPRIRGLCSSGKSVVPSAFAGPSLGEAASKAPARAALLGSTHPSKPVSALGIGSSTGGPNILAAIIPALPKDLPVPVFVVQHMPPVFTQHLAERLNRVSQLTVVEATDGDVVRPGFVYIAPGDYHLTVRSLGAHEQISLSQGPRENSCRPAVDVLFRSLAAAYGSRVCAAVLTGMGKDGLEGSRALRAAGARIFVQNEVTSVVWGMPGYVSRAGLAEAELQPDELAAALLQSTSKSSAGHSERRVAR